MPLCIDNLRATFAHHAAEKRSMDRALAHVITIAYERGLDDARRMPADNIDALEHDALRHFVRSLLDPEMFGHAVTDEVRGHAYRVIHQFAALRNDQILNGLSGSESGASAQGGTP